MGKTYTGTRARIYGVIIGTVFTGLAVGFYAFAGLYYPNVPFPDLGLGVTEESMSLPFLVGWGVTIVTAGGLGVWTLGNALLASDYELTIGESSGVDTRGHDDYDFE